MNFRVINPWVVLLGAYMLLSLRVLVVVTGSPSFVTFAWLAMHLLMIVLMFKARLWKLFFQNANVFGFFVAMIVFWALLSSFWSAIPLETFKTATYLLLYTLGVTFFLNIFGAIRFIRVLLMVLSIAVVLSICILLVGFNLDDDSVGVFPHKNIFGRLSALVAVLWLWWGWVLGRNLTICWFGVIVGIFGAYLSTSAGSLFVLTATLSVFLGYLGLSKIGLKGASVPLIIFSLVVTATWLLLLQKWLTWLEFFEKSETLSGRTFLWSYAVENIQERPFLGYGYATFWKASSINVLISNDITWQAPHAHNGYLDLALDLGVLSAGLYIGILIWVLITSLRRPPTPDMALTIILASFLLSANLLEKTSVLYHDVHYMLFLLALFIFQNGEGIRERFKVRYLQWVRP